MFILSFVHSLLEFYIDMEGKDSMMNHRETRGRISCHIGFILSRRSLYEANRVSALS